MRKQLIWIVIFGLMLTAGSVAQKKVYIVAVPSVTNEENGRAMHEAILRLLLRKTRAGDQVSVFNAYDLKEILTATIPKGNERARKLKLKSERTALHRFFARSVSGRDGKANEIRLPLFLAQAASALRPSAGDARLIVFGTPYYRDSRSPAFSFSRGECPSDGCILATSLQSVFGAKDRRELLKGVGVHWAYLQESYIGADDRAHVARFWALFVQQLGGVLSTFDPDWKVVLRRSVAGTSDSIRLNDKINPNDTKIEIRRVKVVADRPKRPDQEDVAKAEAEKKAAEKKRRLEEERKRAEAKRRAEAARLKAEAARLKAKEEEERKTEEAAAEAKRIKDAAAKRKAERARLKAAAAAISKPKEGFLRIAAVWNGNSQTDVDVYVRPEPRAEELHFRNTTSAEGRYLEDIRSAQKSEKQPSWEVVEIRETTFRETTLWINLYLNDGSRVEGLVRIMFDNRFADVPFVFTGRGDKAAGIQNRQGNVNWISLDVSEAWKKKDRSR